MIKNWLSLRPDHPLADATTVKRIIAELPHEDASQAIVELSAWLKSLNNADDFRVEQRIVGARQLDIAAQWHLRKLTADYLVNPRLLLADEKSLWSVVVDYWELLASIGERDLSTMAERYFDDRPGTKKSGKANDAQLEAFAQVATRTAMAIREMIKWAAFRYESAPNELWQRLGAVYLAAESVGCESSTLSLYPHSQSMTSVRAEYVRALALHAASINCLIPREIELAGYLAAYFASAFGVLAKPDIGTLYWVDAGKAQAPTRMLRRLDAMTPTMRFVSSATVPHELERLVQVLESGELPSDLNLGREYHPRAVLPVLRHLAIYWTSQPVFRAHPRHVVKTRVAVLHGFEDSHSIFAKPIAEKDSALAAHRERVIESWVVENVSLGGFGATTEALRGNWLKVGALVCLLPEGGESWVLGIVRRYTRNNKVQVTPEIDGIVQVRVTQMRVGIQNLQTLARNVSSVELLPYASRYGAKPILAIRLVDDAHAGEVRLLLPPSTFDMREKLVFKQDQKRSLLTPIKLMEAQCDFDFARYRETELA